MSSPASPSTTFSSPSLFLQAHLSSPSPSPPPRPFSLLSENLPLPPFPPTSSSSSSAPNLIPNTRFLVDSFRRPSPSSVSYFLSHFHSDHYSGLSPSWRHGIVYCSPTTARLLLHSLLLPSPFVVPLPLGVPHLIDGTEVTAVDANHCPGAVQFLFKVPSPDALSFHRYVHTGDFRYSDSMKLDPNLRCFVGADAVFLDTTYCHPKFTFPSQEASVEYVATAIERIMALGEKTLFLVATYVVGKEWILLEIARRCRCMIHVDAKKMAVLHSLDCGDPAIFTEDAMATNVHAVGWNVLGETCPYFRPNFARMKEIVVEMGYSRGVGFVPTGWMYETNKDGFAIRVKDSLEIHLVPYSEHSSYTELREYVRFLRPRHVIPTVGLDLDKLDGKHSAAMRKHFANLVDESTNKRDFLRGFHQQSRKIDKGGGENLVGEQVEDAKEVVGPSPLEAAEPRQEGCGASKDPVNSYGKETIEELRGCLPLWVTKEQILELLTCSGGDVVEAASVFYERETELFEQASTYLRESAPAVSPTPIQSELSSAPVNLDCSAKPILGDKGSNNGNLTVTKKNSPRKRGLAAGSKPKKKGKSPSTSKFSGSKQSTITSFFSKATNTQGNAVKLELDVKEIPPDDSDEKYADKLDCFLQIINGGMPKSVATSLLEKAKGDVNVALDMYYSNSCGDRDQPVSCIPKVIDRLECAPSDNFGQVQDEPSAGTQSVDNLPSLANTVEDSASKTLALPLEKYSPLDHACWKTGQPAPYLHLARTFYLVEQEKGKIKTTGILCNMFRSLLALSPEDVLPSVYLCTNKIAPDHENKELNIGFGMVTAALEEACGIGRAKIKEMYNNLGDLGDVAQTCRQSQSLLVPPCSLTIAALFSALRKISMETGNGCATRRKNIIVNLMCCCRENEIKFLVRTLVRNLRIGAMMKTILPSLAQAVVLNSSVTSPESFTEHLKKKLQCISNAIVEAYNILPNLDMLIPALLSSGMDFSPSSLAMVPGMPIPSMLARITNGISEVLKTFQGRAFTCEYKYDGQRAQIHRQIDGTIRVFSRNLSETTFRFPDLVTSIQEMCKPGVTTFILDAEVVAVDRKNRNRLMPFQHLSCRDRGSKDSSIAVDNIKVRWVIGSSPGSMQYQVDFSPVSPVKKFCASEWVYVDICIFVFDVMFYNGEQLLAFPLRQRRKYLKDLLPEEKIGFLEFAKQITVEEDMASISDQDTVSKLRVFLEEACASSCEGMMVKSLDIDAGYAASKRTDSWLKVKRDYIEGLGDNLALVPIGGWHGNGRKANWYSPFLMACYNPDMEEFQSVCRVMSGFSDSFYAEMKTFFSGDKIFPRKPSYYRTDESPALWFSPELVWEIRGAELTLSPVHHAAIGLAHPSRGISMRFPRYVRPIEDRKPEDCSSAADIANLFRLQPRRQEVAASMPD